jgi:hypothetical protein
MSGVPLTPMSTITSYTVTSESYRSSDGDSLRESCAGAPSSKVRSSPGASKKKKGPALAFEGQVVRVTAEQLARWRKAYPLIDVMAMLQVCDDYYSQRPPADGKWFFRVSRWLHEENDKRSKTTTEAEDMSF